MSDRVRDGTAPVLRLVPREAGAVPRPTLDDVEILAAMRRGDPSAATALHDRVRGPVDRALIRVLGARDIDHEELAQKTFIELVRSIDRFRGECSLDTWVARIAAHTAYKAIRRRKLERRVFDGGAEIADIAGPHDLEERTTHRSTLSRVREHLAAIDADKAWTVVLHDVCGYDLREIAQITETSVAAAQTRLVRGRRALHERIATDPELADEIQRRAR